MFIFDRIVRWYNSNDDDVKWDKISSIKRVGWEQVWDISVKNTHNFVANGLLAHNTYTTGGLGVGRATTTAGVIETTGVINVQGAGTSTFANGITLTNGCFFMPSGLCAGSAGSGGAVNTGTANRLAYYSGVGTIDSANFLTTDITNSRLGIGSTSPADTLGVQGNGYFAGNVNLDQFSTYKLNGLTVLSATTTTFNTLAGFYAGANIVSTSTDATSGLYNTALGYEALRYATSTDYNTAVGYQALRMNSGASTDNSGFRNTAIGYLALTSNTSGPYNAALGYGALSENTTGSDNSAVGYSALGANTTGSANVAFGFWALKSNTTGIRNVAIGESALSSNTTSNSNSALGYSALSNNITGALNVAIGYAALGFNGSATNTVAVGYQTAYGTAAYSNQGGTYLGYQAGYSAGTGSDYNTLLGYQAGYGITTGAYNIVIGQNVEAPTVTSNQQLNIGNLLYGSGIYNGSSVSAAPVLNSRLGVGTTTPFAKLSIHAFNGETNTALFAVASSTASATTTLFVINNNGNVGVGTTSPSQALSVLGHCVTGDTRLRRRRRRKNSKSKNLNPKQIPISNDPNSKHDGLENYDLEFGNYLGFSASNLGFDEEYLYDEVRIDQIQPGDEVLSLNEKTGTLEYRKIEQLWDMGVKPVYKLMTASGRTITTTGNHAYLTRKSQITNHKSQINSKFQIPNKKHFSLFERGLVNTLENPFHSESPIQDAEWMKVYGLAVGDEIMVPDSTFGPTSGFFRFNNKQHSFQDVLTGVSEEVNRALDNHVSRHTFNVNNYHSGRMFNIETFNISKVLVKGEEYARWFLSIIKKFLIGSAFQAGFDSAFHLKSVFAQGINHVSMNAVVGENPHVSFARESLDEDSGWFFRKTTRKFNGREDISFGNAGILRGDLVNGVAGSKQIQNVGDSNSRPSNTGPAEADIRIDSNSLHISHSSDSHAGVKWDSIISIQFVGNERVYDISVEGTHNFVAGHYMNQKTGKALTPEEEETYVAYKNSKSQIPNHKQITSSNDQNIKRFGISNFEFGNCLEFGACNLGFAEEDIVFGGIFAHNTYLTGGLGVGRATTSAGVIETTGIINIQGAGTSTFTNGINLTDGCITLQGGTCIGGGGSGTINSGTTNRLAYYTGGTTLDSANFLTVDPTNLRLGIATATPATTFSVAGNTYLDSNVITFASSSAASLTLAFQKSATSTIPSAVNAFSFATSLTGTPLLSLDTTNTRVGVNDISPDAMLDFDFSSTNTVGGTEYGGFFTVTDTGAVQADDTTYGTRISTTRTGALSGAISTYGLYSDVTGDTGATSVAVAIYGSATGADNNYAAIFANGSVGIGTTTPGAKLSLAGSGGATDNFLLSGINMIYASSSTSTIRNSAVYSWTIATSTTAVPILSISTNGGLATTSITGGFSIDSGAVEYDFTPGTLSVDNLNIGAMSFDTDAGIVTWADMPVATNATGTINSYTAQVDGTPILTIQGVASGSGSVGTTTVGIGTTTPAWKLTVSNSATTTTKAFIGLSDNLAGANLKHWTMSSQGGSFYVATSSDLYATSSIPRLAIDSNGWVGIGTANPQDELHVVGDIRTSACASDGAGDVACVDIAESYTAGETVAAGDIVAVAANPAYAASPTTTTEYAVVRASGTSTILGIVSTRPALYIEGVQARFGGPILAGTYDAGDEAPVALAGRVPVKVSTENGEIKIGDRVAISSLAGVGMLASSSVETVGIALEEFDGSESTTTILMSDGRAVKTAKILVFVNRSSAPLDSGLSFLASAASSSASGPLNAWSVDQSTGKVNVNFFGDVNMQGNQILDVSRIAGMFGNWSIAEDGTIIAKKIITDELVTKKLSVDEGAVFGSQANPIGITIYDEDTKEPFCIKMKSGAMVSAPGACAIVGSDPTSEPAPEPAPESVPSPEPAPELPIPSPTSDVGATESSILDLSTPSDDGGQIGTAPEPVVTEPPLESFAEDLTGQAAPEPPPAEEPAPAPEPTPPITSAEPPPAT